MHLPKGLIILPCLATQAVRAGVCFAGFGGVVRIPQSLSFYQRLIFRSTIALLSSSVLHVRYWLAAGYEAGIAVSFPSGLCCARMLIRLTP
jgi:hypothetical protein